MKLRHAAAIVFLAHVIPAIAWAAVKPLRLVAPELNGVACTQDRLCTDDPARLPEARALLAEAEGFVGRELGAIHRRPTVVFCSTDECSRAFGLTGAAGITVGPLGVVMAKRGWQPFYVRHELIHVLQYERLGTLQMWLFTPSWFIEGMAYGRSEDPRQSLSQPFQGWRERYGRWEASLAGQDLWAAAERLR